MSLSSERRSFNVSEVLYARPVTAWKSNLGSQTLSIFSRKDEKTKIRFDSIRMSLAAPVRVTQNLPAVFVARLPAAR